MESSQELNSDTLSDDPQRIGEQLDELCIYYMSLGMTYEDFWYGDYCKLKYIREADELKKARANADFYMQGFYNFRAFNAVMESFSYGMNGKKGKKPEPYLKAPVPVTEVEKEIEKQRRIQHTLAWVAKGQKDGN